MKHDDSGSWDALESTWQADDHPSHAHPSSLLARMGRRRQWIDRTVLVSEFLVTLVFGSLAVWWLWTGSPAERVAGAFVLTLLAVVSFLRRHAWLRGSAVHADAPHRYIQSLLGHNAAGHRAVHLGWRLLAVQVIFFMVWFPWRTESTDLMGSYAFLALWAGGFSVALRASTRYLRRERRKLEMLRDELEET